MTKTKVIALNTIIRTIEPGKPGDKNAGIAPTPPKTMEIPAGAHFMLDPEGDEYKELKAAEAIRDYTKSDAAAFALFTNVLNADEPAADGEDAGTAAVKTVEKKAKTTKKAAADNEDDDGKGLV